MIYKSPPFHTVIRVHLISLSSHFLVFCHLMEQMLMFPNDSMRVRLIRHNSYCFCFEIILHICRLIQHVSFIVLLLPMYFYSSVLLNLQCSKMYSLFTLACAYSITIEHAILDCLVILCAHNNIYVNYSFI